MEFREFREWWELWEGGEVHKLFISRWLFEEEEDSDEMSDMILNLFVTLNYLNKS